MKILICSHASIDSIKGGTRLLLEIAGELRNHGCQVDLIDPRGIGLDFDNYHDLKTIYLYTQRLREYLLKNACKYDVVEYNYSLFPFDRNDFPKKTLFVARCFLLQEHLEHIKIPKKMTIRSIFLSFFSRLKGQRLTKKLINLSQATCKQADLIIVCNKDDKYELKARGIDENKVAVIHLGNTKKRRALFDITRPEIPSSLPTIAFVGTFDYRKGAADFPYILNSIVQSIPNVKFKLLGTFGMYSEEAQVRHFLGKNLQSNLEIHHTFDPDKLPDLLSDCWLGFFPSYLEGFPYGIVDMMSAHLPVIAYNCPGPKDMMNTNLLIQVGDRKSMAQKIIYFLSQPEQLLQERIIAKKKSNDFSWEIIGEENFKLYLNWSTKLKSKDN